MTVVLELAAENVCAWVDRGQLENALLNLAINARDAMPSGGTLCLRSRHETERDEVVIEVSDDGQGMDPVIRDRVFEPFFTTKTDSGSGLGLSIVYGFIRQSGGEIELKSAPGKGTTFVLHLPTHAREPDDSANAADESSTEGQSLLLVEDNADVRATLADLLGATGHVVTAAKSAEEALQLLATTFQSIVLSDVDLGGKTNGVQLMKTIAERYPTLPCILMSGLPAEILVSRFGFAGEQPLIAKPFTIPQLDAAIRDATSRSQGKS